MSLPLSECQCSRSIIWVLVVNFKFSHCQCLGLGLWAPYPPPWPRRQRRRPGPAGDLSYDCCQHWRPRTTALFNYHIMMSTWSYCHGTWSWYTARIIVLPGQAATTQTSPAREPHWLTTIMMATWSVADWTRNLVWLGVSEAVLHWAGLTSRLCQSSGNPYPFASFTHLPYTRDMTWISYLEKVMTSYTRDMTWISRMQII